MNYRHFDQERLKQLRAARNETQKQVAEALGVNRQSIYRAEAGGDIAYEFLCDLAEYYAVPVVTLLHPIPKAA